MRWETTHGSSRGRRGAENLWRGATCGSCGSPTRLELSHPRLLVGPSDGQRRRPRRSRRRQRRERTLERGSSSGALVISRLSAAVAGGAERCDEIALAEHADDASARIAHGRPTDVACSKLLRRASKRRVRCNPDHCRLHHVSDLAHRRSPETLGCTSCAEHSCWARTATARSTASWGRERAASLPGSDSSPEPRAGHLRRDGPPSWA